MGAIAYVPGIQSVQTIFSAGVSTMGNTAGNTGLTGGQLVLAGIAGITASQSTDSNGATVTLSGSFGTGTTITGNASITFGAGGMSFNGSGLAGTTTAITGNASITLNSSGLRFNGSNLMGVGTSITGNASITANSAGLQFNGSNLMGVGTSITGRASITANSVGIAFNGTGLAGTGYTQGTTLGAQTATNNSAGLSMVVPYRTRYIYPDGNQMTTIGQLGNATLSIQYLDINEPITASRLDVLMSMSFSTSAGGGTQTYQYSGYAVIYTANASTLSSISSGSTQSTYTLASNSAGVTAWTQAAIRPLSIPINVNMAPGEYFVGVNIVTANTAGSATFSVMGNTMVLGQNYAEITAQTATSSNVYSGMGLYSAATTGTLANVSLSAINATGVNLASANVQLVFRNA